MCVCVFQFYIGRQLGYGTNLYPYPTINPWQHTLFSRETNMQSLNFKWDSTEIEVDYFRMK